MKKSLEKYPILILFPSLFNLLYIKEFVLVNSRTYDRYHDMVSKKSEDYIVLIDANVNHPEDVSMRGKLKVS